MLDMGFKPAVDRIVAQTPDERQTLFFSATLEGATGKLAAAYTRDARRHTHAEPERGDGRHRAPLPPRRLPERQARPPGRAAGAATSGGRTLVFVRTKRGADRLVKRLRGREVEAVAMHGDKSQRQRERALARFERGDVEALVATDVAARGIDVADITHVINFDAPEDRDSYVHRVGRTGRAGRTGTGISFVLADQADEMRRIAGDLGLIREFTEPRHATGPSAPASHGHGGATAPASRGAGARRPMSAVAATARVDLRPLRRLRQPHRRRAARRCPTPGPASADGSFCLPAGASGPRRRRWTRRPRQPRRRAGPSCAAPA